MNEEQDTYGCEKCGMAWGFFPEDFENGEYPTICPHCEMPVWDLIKNTFREGGLKETIKWLIVRYL